MSPEEITALRIGLCLTRTELARKLGVSRQALWEWESGKKLPRATNLEKLAALAISQPITSHKKTTSNRDYEFWQEDAWMEKSVRWG